MSTAGKDYSIVDCMNWCTSKAAMMVIGMAFASSCGGHDKACFSPTSNASSASQEGAQGCACNPAVDRDVCSGGGTMVCRGGHWGIGKDGPCMVPDGGAFPGDAGNEVVVLFVAHIELCWWLIIFRFGILNVSQVAE